MSRVDELLARLAPDGVQHRRVEDLLSVHATGSGVKRGAYGDAGRIPIVDQGQALVGGYTDDESLALPAGEYIVFGDHTRTVKWVDFRFAVGADGTKVLKAGPDLLPRYAYYAFSRVDIPSRGYNRHWTVARQARIPVPPCEVQAEIVRILDSFQQLQGELEAELEVRREQYAYYRDALLAFGDAPLVTLAELGTLYGGLSGKSAADFAEGDTPYISYTNVFANIRASANEGDRFALRPGERQNQVARGDVLFTISSESREESGMSSVVLSEPDEPTYLNSFCFGFRPASGARLDPEFSKYLFRSTKVRSQIVRAANGVTRFNISRAQFMKTMIPMPPIEEQRRIASILDSFDALVNDLSSGLPAEIAARRQQYEHYRDRLLTFKEAHA